MDPQVNHSPDQQTQGQPNSQGIYSTGPASKEIKRIKPKSLVAWGIFGVLVLGVIGSIIYGANSLLTVANEEREKLAAIQSANEALPEEERVYFGDGSDIVQIADAKEVVGCPSGYTEKGDKCEKTETKTANPANYSCPSDYKKQGGGSSTTCVKIVGGTKESKPATRAVVCDNGYSLSGDKCVGKETATLKVSYSCSSGYQLSGVGAATKCTKTTTQNGAVRADCPKGTPSGSGADTKCNFTEVQTVDVSTNTTYSCPSGYSQSGKTGPAMQCDQSYPAERVFPGCAYDSTANLQTVDSGGIRECRYSKKIVTESCPSGWNRGSVVERVGSRTFYRCSKIVVYAPISYKCVITYKVSGTSCVRSANPVVTVSTNCPADYTKQGTGVNTKCQKSEPKSVDANLFCDKDYAKKGSGSNTSCVRVHIQNASPNESKYCDGGYSRVGDQCEKTITRDGESRYTCESGYDVSGSSCTRIVGGTEVKTDPSVSYKCPSGYKSEGSGSNMKCSKTEVSTADKLTKYLCEDGWQKRQAGNKFDCVLVES